MPDSSPDLNLPAAPAGQPARLPTPVPAADVVLDAVALGRLRELDPDGSRGLLPRLLLSFETALLRLLDQMPAAAAAGDAAAVCAQAHTLKSSSASVGALALSQVCAEVERRIRLAPPSAGVTGGGVTGAGVTGAGVMPAQAAAVAGSAPAAVAGLVADAARLHQAGTAALQAVRAMLRP